MLEYICAQKKSYDVLKNANIFKNWFEIIFSLYEICSIY